MVLPLFDAPTKAELREWYRRYRSNKEVWRLILEVQRSRDQLAVLAEVVRGAIDAAAKMRSDRLFEPGAPLHRANEILYQEILRAGSSAREKPRNGVRPPRVPSMEYFDPSNDDDKADELTRVKTERHSS